VEEEKKVIDKKSRVVGEKGRRERDYSIFFKEEEDGACTGVEIIRRSFLLSFYSFKKEGKWLFESF